MAKGKVTFWVLLAGAGAACISTSYRVRNEAERKLVDEASLAHEESRRIQQQVVLFANTLFPRGFLS
jgi:hypothetical protein